MKESNRTSATKTLESNNESNKCSTVDTSKAISFDEGYKLVQGSVKYYLSLSSFSHVTSYFSIDDAIQEIMLKCVRKKIFEAYDESKASKRYYINVLVHRQ
jgi:hypothetical protein